MLLSYSKGVWFISRRVLSASTEKVCFKLKHASEYKLREQEEIISGFPPPPKSSGSKTEIYNAWQNKN